MKEQTSIDWLIIQIKEDQLLLSKSEHDWLGIFEKAKQLHKKEIIEAWNIAHQAGRFEGKGIAEENWQTFEQYYNEKYQ